MSANSSNADHSEIPTKALYSQKAVDSIYKARYSRFVSTLSFAENVTLYSTTGSKAAVNMNSASSSGGSMSTILTWLKSRVKESPVLFPEMVTCLLLSIINR